MPNSRGKLLVVSYYWPPLNSPVTQHPTWFFRFLQEAGWETHALTSSIYFAQILTAPPYRGPGIHALPESPLAQKILTRFYQTELWWQLPLRAWEHGFYWGQLLAQREADRLIATGGFSAMISVSPTAASHWTALKIKRRHPHLRWIADFQDPLIGNPFRHEHPRFIRWLERFEREVFSEADLLSANTNTVKEMWDARYPEFAAKTIVTWGGYDPAEAADPLPLPARPAPLLSHAGAVYGARVPNRLFDALARLSSAGLVDSSRLNIEFLGSNDFREIEDPAQLARLEASGIVRLRNEYIPRPDAMMVARQANYLLVLDIAAGGAKLQVPSKLFDYIRIGRPILLVTAPGSPSQYIIERSGVPYVMVHTNSTPQQYDEAVLRLLALPSTPVAPSDWFTENFDARNLSLRLSSLLEKPVS